MHRRTQGVLSSPYVRRIVARLLLVTLLGAGPAYGDTSAAEYNAKGVEAYNDKSWEEAIHYFGKAYELARDNPTVRRNLCNAYQAHANELARANDFATAADLLNVAISVDPENASPLAQLGAYYLRLDMSADAVYRLEEAAELDSANLDVLDLLGDAYYKQNDLASALAQWEIVREIQPNRKGLREKLEKAYREASVEYDFNKLQSAHFQISYARGTNGGDLSKVFSLLERAYRDIGRRCGGVYPPTPIQVIAYTADDFAKATLLGEHVGAVYDGKIRVPIRDKSGQSIAPGELQRRLYHEYTHVVVRFWAGNKVPWWFNEGLAETFSSDLSSSDVELLQRAQSAGALLPLSELEEAQLHKLDPETLQLAYRQAHATVRFLWNRYGQAGLANMLNGLANGMSREESLVAAYRLNYDLLERQVVHSFGRMLSQR